jgi:hypothetical protein
MTFAPARRALRGFVLSVVLVAGLAFAPAALADPVLVTDPSHNYGDVNISGGPSTYGFIVNNPGPFSSLTVTGTSLTGVDAGDFTITDGCTGGPAIDPMLPFPCVIDVAFNPSTLGAKSATLEITSDEVPSLTRTIPLTGVGIDAAALIAPGSLAFGSRTIGAGATATQQVTVTSNGTTALNVAAVSIIGANFNQFVLGAQTCTTASPIAPAGTCTVDVSFDPDSVGAKTADLRIVSSGLGSPQLVPLTGTGTEANATALPATLGFGSRDRTAGQTATQQVTVTSTGSSALNVAMPTLVGANPGDFVIDAQTCLTLSPIANGDTCTVDVSFDPSTVGAKSATLRIASDAAGSPHDVALTGTGTGPDGAATPTPVAFGSQDVASGATAALTVTFTSNGTSAVTPGAPALGGGDAAEFAIGLESCSIAGALAPATTCTVYVTFDPSSAGVKSATLSIPSNGTSTPHVVTLSGTGTVPDGAVLPASHAFGSRAIDAGATTTQTFTFTSSGGSPVTPAVVSIVGADPTQFVLGADTCTAAGPISLAGTCTVAVSFDPSTIGAKAATLRITSNAATSPHEATLTGTGAPNPAPTAVTAFAMSADSFVAGNAAAIWNVAFRPTTALSGSTSDTVSVTFAPGFNVSGATYTQSASAGGFSCAAPPTLGIAGQTVTITLTSTCSATAGVSSAIGLTGITAPVGTYAAVAFTISTSKDTVGIESNVGVTIVASPPTTCATGFTLVGVTCVASTPTPPTKLRVTYVNLRSVGLAWVAGTIATGEDLVYLVEIRESGTTSWTQVGIVSSLSTSVTALGVNTSYEIQVTSVSESGAQSAPSSTVTARTKDSKIPIVDIPSKRMTISPSGIMRFDMRCLDAGGSNQTGKGTCSTKLRFELISADVRGGGIERTVTDLSRSCGEYKLGPSRRDVEFMCQLDETFRPLAVVDAKKCRHAGRVTGGRGRIIVTTTYTDGDGQSQRRTQSFEVTVVDLFRNGEVWRSAAGIFAENVAACRK